MTLSTALAAPAHAALLNGGFETVQNAAPRSTTTFSNWQELANSGVGAGTFNAATTHAGITAGSLMAARIIGGASGGALAQNDVESTPDTWEFNLDFATVDPGGPNDRSFDLLLFFEFNTPGGSGGHEIHLRVVDADSDGDGDLQAFRRDIDPDLGTPAYAEWVTLASDLPFSTDLGSDGSLTDPGDVLKPIHLHVAGDFANPTGPRYTVTAGNQPAVSVNYFQDGVPSPAHNNIDRLAFAGNFSTTGYVVDNVTLTTVVAPEPNSLMMCCFGALATGAAHRRRGAKPRSGGNA